MKNRKLERFVPFMSLDGMKTHPILQSYPFTPSEASSRTAGTMLLHGQRPLVRG